MEERQQMYETQGRDDYIFRIDKDWFCDATVKGSMARNNFFPSVISLPNFFAPTFFC